MTAVCRAQPYRRAGHGEDLVLTAVETHPVTRAQHRRRPHQPAVVTAAHGCSGTDKSVTSSNQAWGTIPW